MKPHALFKKICRDLWGDEFIPHAVKADIGSRRSIIYWAKGDHEPADWAPIFAKLRKIAADKSLEYLNRAERLQAFAHGRD